ncbi:MAG: hypothetical protein RJQ04_13690 [Longimicrobiales bacterium]
MPARYTFDPVTRTVEITCSGILTLGEIVQYFEDLAADDAVTAGVIEVVDLTGVDDFAVSSSEASGIPGAFNQVQAEKSIEATFLLGSSDANFGVGRMIQSYFHSRLPDHPIEVVRSRAEVDARLREMGRGS